MTNDVHSRVARVVAWLKVKRDCSAWFLDAGRESPLDKEQVEMCEDAIRLINNLADDAEKMLALLLEARENDMQVCDYDFINTGGLPKYEDGPLGKKIAEFLEGK